MNTHIKFNDILEDLKEKIKKSKVNLGFIKEFQGLILHLQRQSTPSHQQLLEIEGEEVKAHNLNPLVKKLRKKIQ